jgi:hypothetical protein
MDERTRVLYTFLLKSHNESSNQTLFCWGSYLTHNCMLVFSAGDTECPKKVKTINHATCLPSIGTENTRSEPCDHMPPIELPEGGPLSTDSVCRIILV